MNNYYNPELGNYTIPANKFKYFKDEVLEFLKHNRDYFLIYLSKDDMYDMDYWCITNWLE